MCCSRYSELNTLQSGVIIASQESEAAKCLQEERVTMWVLKYRSNEIEIRRSQVLSCTRIRLYSWHTPSLRCILYRCTVYITNLHTSVHTLHFVMSSAAELSLTRMMLFIAVFVCSLCFKFTRCQSIRYELWYVSLDLRLPSALAHTFPQRVVKILAISIIQWRFIHPHATDWSFLGYCLWNLTSVSETYN
jgi:hypothetical protein